MTAGGAERQQDTSLQHVGVYLFHSSPLFIKSSESPVCSAFWSKSDLFVFFFLSPLYIQTGKGVWFDLLCVMVDLVLKVVSQWALE